MSPRSNPYEPPVSERVSGVRTGKPWLTANRGFAYSVALNTFLVLYAFLFGSQLLWLFIALNFFGCFVLYLVGVPPVESVMFAWIWQTAVIACGGVLFWTMVGGMIERRHKINQVRRAMLRETKKSR